MLLNLQKTEVFQLIHKDWDNSLDHTPILHNIKNVNIKMGKRKVSSIMLHNDKNKVKAS